MGYVTEKRCKIGVLGLTKHAVVKLNDISCFGPNLDKISNILWLQNSKVQSRLSRRNHPSRRLRSSSSELWKPPWNLLESNNPPWFVQTLDTALAVYFCFLCGCTPSERIPALCDESKRRFRANQSVFRSGLLRRRYEGSAKNHSANVFTEAGSAVGDQRRLLSVNWNWHRSFLSASQLSSQMFRPPLTAPWTLKIYIFLCLFKIPCLVQVVQQKTRVSAS